MLGADLVEEEFRLTAGSTTHKHINRENKEQLQEVQTKAENENKG